MSHGCNVGGELGFDPSLEGAPIHRTVDHSRGGPPVMPQPGNERMGATAVKGRLDPEALELARPATQTGQVVVPVSSTNTSRSGHFFIHGW
ncbi:MAG: hypothetical protein ABL878_16830 [Burkholderiales bacterium]